MRTRKRTETKFIVMNEKSRLYYTALSLVPLSQRPGLREDIVDT